MAAVDPYSPCPCGSGQKFKWCCHKVEAYADRAQRLAESGQIDAAIEVLDEGLGKERGNPWLLTRKAVYQLRQRQPQAAKATIRAVLERQPKHVGALMLLTRLVLETEGPVAGVAQLQNALAAALAEGRGAFLRLVQITAAVLSEGRIFPAALKHLELAQSLAPEEERSVDPARLIDRSPSVSPWQKNRYELSPPPGALAGPARDRFEEAVRSAGEGLWGSAASAFELLSAEPAAAAEADRNLGLCRLWMADEPAAIAALRRYTSRAGATTDAVDLEALCQQIEEPRGDDLVEHVQLIWPVRDRDALLETLRADTSAHELGVGPIDEGDPDSPEVEHFGLLDRPAIAWRDDLRVDEIPRFTGRVLVGQEIVALESYDDGRLDALSDRFMALAGQAISPAHPRTKVLGKVTRTSLALSWDWLIPEGTPREAVRKLNREEGARLIGTTWPETPMPALAGRTPLQAAQAGGFEVPLRAAVFQLQLTHEEWGEAVDFDALRGRLKIGPEPPIDPATADFDRIHLARLELVPVDGLDDDRLAALHRRAKEFGLVGVVERTARALVGRPDIWERTGISPLGVYSDLAALAADEEKADEAYDWIRRGRQADPAASRAGNAPKWDMLELRIKTRFESPESWVPELAVILDRYADNPTANTVVMMDLIDMGIIEMAPHPERRDDFLIDTRGLQALLARYGPRVTTASGRLGVAATKGDLWTPGSEAGGAAGGIWTPGSGAAAPAPAGDKPKLIIPGR